MIIWNNKFLQKEEIMSNILSQKTIHMQVTRVECRKKNEVSQHNYLYLHNILWFFNEKKKPHKKKIKPSWQVEKQKRTYKKSSSTTECCTNERLWYCPIKLRPIQGPDTAPEGQPVCFVFATTRLQVDNMQIALAN